jgi:hypothetical protein
MGIRSGDLHFIKYGPSRLSYILGTFFVTLLVCFILKERNACVIRSDRINASSVLQEITHCVRNKLYTLKRVSTNQ